MNFGIKNLETIVLAMFLVLALYFGFSKLSGLVSSLGIMPLSLPLLAIGGVIVLILVLTIVAVIFQGLDLTDKRQAMGLPEGSIRAVIALSLIVLFAILSVFLYQGVSGPISVIENLSEADRIQMMKEYSKVPGFQALEVKGSSPPLYNVTYRGASDPNSNDFAKQLLVLLGTLMTAITSFYLGAGTATSVAAQANNFTNPSPTVTGVNPSKHKIADQGALISLEITGSSLNATKHVKIVRAGVEIVGTGIVSGPTRVTCNIAVSAATTPPGSPWDVVIDDGVSKSTTLPGALKID